jgi:hypothetical protein
MKHIAAILLLLFTTSSNAQVDTLHTQNNKMLISALKEGKATYAVYFEDSIGNRLSSADLWNRTVSITSNATGQKQYRFEWTVWRKDSLQASVVSTGLVPSLQPVSHKADYVRRGTFSFSFDNGIVTVPDEDRKNAKDSALKVVLDPPGFAFPMDLEILPLVPMKKAGQQFAIAFYEPGSPRSNYYLLTVTGKENLPLVGGLHVPCWLLRLDYGRGTYATFWISEKTREVLKMQEYIRGGRYRYKVRLY